MMELQQGLALAVFVGVYVLFASRLLHRALAALMGALVLAVWAGPGAVLSSVLPEVLLVTAGLMVLAGFVRRSGAAAWLALKAAKAGRGRPGRILVLTGLLTFLIGALLGPVAAVVLVVPVALLLAMELDVSAVPFVVVLSWTSLLGGASVLTATPGNLWVATGLGIRGSAWLAAILPFTVSALVVTLTAGLLLFRKQLRVTNERRARVLEYDESRSLQDRPLLVKTLTVVALVVAGLISTGLVGVAPSVVVLTGAVLLMLWDGPKAIDRSLAEIDAGTLLFYAGLFAVVVALAVSGVSQILADALGSQPFVLLWGTAVLGAFLDQGAVAGALVPTLQIASGGTGVWVPVVLGSTLGAGATILGAASSASALSLTGQGAGKATWKEFTKYGVIFALLNLLVVSGLGLLLFR